MSQADRTLWGTLRSLSLVIEHEVYLVLRDLDLTVSQYEALTVYAQNPGIHATVAARMCCLQPQTALISTHALIRKELLERSRTPGDGPRKVAQVTAKGFELLRRADERVASIEARLRNSLADETPPELESLLIGLIVTPIEGRA